MITTPEQAIYERFYASGMTSYSYEDICRAATACNEAEALYQETVKLAGEALVPYRDEGLIAWELYLEGVPAELVAALYKYNLSPVNTIGKNREQWPVRKWEAKEKEYRRAAAKIQSIVKRLP